MANSLIAQPLAKSNLMIFLAKHFRFSVPTALFGFRAFAVCKILWFIDFMHNWFFNSRSSGVTYQHRSNNKEMLKILREKLLRTSNTNLSDFF